MTAAIGATVIWAHGEVFLAINTPAFECGIGKTAGGRVTAECCILMVKLLPIIA